MLKLIRNLTLAITLLSSVIVVSSVTAVTSAKPTVSNFKVSPLTLNYVGGSVTLSATVKDATRCIFTTTPAVAGVYKNIACNSGKVTYVAKLPENSTTKNATYTFKLIVTGKKGDGNVTAPLKTVTVVAGPKPAISSFTTSNSELPSAGGVISLTGVVSNEASCKISANPAIEGTSSNPVPCSTGSAIASVAMPPTPSSATVNINYTFTLTVTGISGATVSKTLVVTVDSNPPATTTTTTPPPTTTTTTYPPTVGNTVSVAAEPDAFTVSGSNIWVGSCSGNAVTEINASTKQIVQVLTGSSYSFDCPDALVAEGSNIWVANKLGSSLTEFNATTGALVRTLTGSDILNPDALAVVGSDIWVLDDAQVDNEASFISEFNTSNGVEVRTIVQPKNFKFVLGSPYCLAVVGSDIWVADSINPYAIEFNTNNGAYIRKTIGGPATPIVYCVVYHSGYIWVSGSNSVAEFNATTGVYVRSISNIVYPNQLFFTGNDLFLESQSPVDSVREYTSTGTLLRTVVKSNKALGKGISSILVDGSSLWTANYSANSVTKSAL